MSEPSLFDVISTVLKKHGYIVRQLPDSGGLWYATSADLNRNLSLTKTEDGWKVNDIAGNSRDDRDTIEQELNDECN